MAALTASLVEAAAAARAEARAQRLQAQVSRFELRRRNADVQRAHAACSETYAGLERTRGVRQCSPWSDLAWRYPGADLDLILVPWEGDA
ncbi:MAG: hypothetical protein ACRDL2_03870 [Gaiellaceae bacterium]